jgi:type II secretory pathway pseudopilin PulG
MKKAFSLIELIFTMVIVAFTFSVIPKIIEYNNKALSFSKKEDAIYNLISKTIDISVKEFDEHNVGYDGILLVNNPPVNVLDCNLSSNYRVGGFVGSRQCPKEVYVSSTFKDDGEPPYDDVDDYYDYKEDIKSGHTTYTLKATAGYTDEWKSYSTASLEYNFTSTSNTDLTNIKRVEVSIYDDGKKIASLKYYSANIGHITTQSEQW